jgi:oxygen-dependent protoporphyrinogen oxidase
MTDLPASHRTEVAIVGGGLAGLAAAWALRDRALVVLEADDRVGGRLYSLPRDPYWLNLGAGVFSSEESPVRALIREVGLITREIPGNMMGLALGNTIAASGRVELYPLRLPLSLSGRLSFIQAGARLRLAVSEYNRLAQQRPGETAEDAEARLFAFEGDRSFKAFLGPLHPDVEAIFRCTAANRIGTELEDLSATGGIGTYAYQFSAKASHLSHNLVGGSARLPEALAARLDGRICTRARVERIEPGPEGVTLTYTLRGEPRQLLAEAVIVATPADIARTLIQGLPARLSEALRSVRYGQAVLLAVLTDELTPMPYDKLYALSTPQRRFTILINVASTLRSHGQRLPGGSLLAYAGGNLAREYFNKPDAEVERQFLDELYGLYPETKSVVRETIVQRWERIVPYSFPGRYKLQPAFNEAMERVFLAGDYLGNWANMEVAVASGQRAARQAGALLKQH